MPKKTKKSASATRKASSSSRSAGRKNGSHGGIYTTPHGEVSIMVPAFWSFRQTNDDLELDSPTEHTSVVVSAFKRDTRAAALDSRDYLERFLQTAPANGRRKVDLSTKSRAVARFKDGDNTAWQVEFLTDGNKLLLATLSTSEGPRSMEGRTAAAVLASIKLRKK